MKFEDIKKQIEDHLNHDVIESIAIKKEQDGYRGTDFFIILDVFYKGSGVNRRIFFKNDVFHVCCKCGMSQMGHRFFKESHNPEDIGKFIAEGICHPMFQDSIKKLDDCPYCNQMGFTGKISYVPRGKKNE